MHRPIHLRVRPFQHEVSDHLRKKSIQLELRYGALRTFATMHSISRLANRFPIHDLGPNPNGKKTKGFKFGFIYLLPVPRIHLSGMYLFGSGKFSSFRHNHIFPANTSVWKSSFDSASFLSSSITYALRNFVSAKHQVCGALSEVSDSDRGESGGFFYRGSKVGHFLQVFRRYRGVGVRQ